MSSFTSRLRRSCIRERGSRRVVTCRLSSEGCSGQAQPSASMFGFDGLETPNVVELPAVPDVARTITFPAGQRIVFDRLHAENQRTAAMNGAKSLLKSCVSCDATVCFGSPGASEMHVAAAFTVRSQTPGRPARTSRGQSRLQRRNPGRSLHSFLQPTQRGIVKMPLGCLYSPYSIPGPRTRPPTGSPPDSEQREDSVSDKRRDTPWTWHDIRPQPLSEDGRMPYQ